MATTYSIIIPAYNEEKWLSQTLSSLQDSMSTLEVSGEIVVVDNNSTDQTARIARQHDAQVVFEPINQISRARNAGAKVAKGRYFIFMDADTFISTALLQTALKNLSSGICCGGGGIVGVDDSLQPLARQAINLWNWISMKFGVAAGCFIYCLREGFAAVGGFSEKVYASEEIWFSRQLHSWGKKRQMAFQIIPSPPITTSIRKLEWFSPFPLLILMSALIVFPFLLRFRLPCSYWYHRPKKT